jgi:two-component system NarL family sensor kinase
MAQRRSELRSYVDLAVSVVQPLYDTGRDDEASRAEALRRLAALDYGDDGYFFVYDPQGRSLMHSRQPELVGQQLWELRDSRGRATVQDLIAQARRGGGYVEYEWRKPSTGQPAPKLGYVTVLPRRNWMVGSGLYLDDIDSAMKTLDHQMSAKLTTTMLWIAGIAALCLAVVSATGLLLNLSEHRVAETRLRNLARQVVQSQEDERSHLSRELHDGTSRMLVSSQAGGRIRRGCAGALARAGAGSEDGTVPGDPGGLDQCTQAFEGDAGAHRTGFSAGGVRLDISDDGRGFDAEAVQADPSSGIGLRNMRERVAAIGGTLHVRSDGAGTSVVADVPVSAGRSA